MLIRSRGIVAAPVDATRARRFRERTRISYIIMTRRGPTCPTTTLAATLDEWLAPHLSGVRKLGDLARVDLVAALSERSRLAPAPRSSTSSRRRTSRCRPARAFRSTTPNPDAPVLAVRLQEVFGLTESPRVFGGRVPVTMHLLSPAHRPVQVTQDLAGFWRTSYFDVRKDLRGRYPKHEWPEDPLTATPTKRAKPRK